MNKIITFPLNGREAPGLPAEFKSVTEWAEKAGCEHARELLGALVFFQERDEDPRKQEEAARAFLSGFLAPMLPVLADSLALFPAGAGVVETLIDGLVHGAAMALESMGGTNDD
ncbi:hypothetical protein [Paludibacterium yongneupense]|uniref:hypothetical protein n=1 Tax=Paludibacterium yongneupense TaxID=400061 RepID=UPI00041DE923|nr:hypothetical protein [Paludibacterium yongneupense]